VPAIESINAAAGECGAKVAAVFTAEATGTPVPAIVYKVGGEVIDADYLFPVGSTIVTAIATNTCGTVEKQIAVLVKDITLPIVKTKSITVKLDASGNVTIKPEDVNDSSSDACGIKGLALDKTSFNCTNVGDNTVTLSVIDQNSNVATEVATVTVKDESAPVFTAVPALITLATDANKCGALVTYLTPTASDNCTYNILQTAGLASSSVFPIGTTTNTFTVTDASGNAATASFDVVVTNDLPQLKPLTFTAPATPLVINSTVNMSIGFVDDNLKSAVWNWDDGSSSTGHIDFTNRRITGNRTYTTPGVYTPTVTVTDWCGQTTQETYLYVVIYDPNGGFVTGGGWINSPAGAYKADLALAGKANFGFVAKYKKGSSVPDGNTEFQFKTGNLNFNSTAYDDMRLVIAGAKANYKGVGTINGSGNYGFMVAAIDGQYNKGTGPDKFRIKIWDRSNGDIVVYDNNLNSVNAGEDADPEMTIAGGSIVIHAAKSARESAASEPESAAAALALNAYPNPFSGKATVRFVTAADEDYTLDVYDLKGMLVQRLKAGKAQAGRLTQVVWEAGQSPIGLYVIRLTTKGGVQHVKLVRK
jgi:hypothetical protein